MSVKSAMFNSLFTTGQKINIAVTESYRFYSNIRALAMLSRCSLELYMGVLPASEPSHTHTQSYSNPHPPIHGHICPNYWPQFCQKSKGDYQKKTVVSLSKILDLTPWDICQQEQGRVLSQKTLQSKTSCLSWNLVCTLHNTLFL